MKAYKVIVEGANFFLPGNGNKVSGFFSTLLIKGHDIDDIFQQTQTKFEARIQESNIQNINGIFGSNALIDSIYEVNISDVFEKVEGFTFYDMTALQRIINIFKYLFYKIFCSEKILTLGRKN